MRAGWPCMALLVAAAGCKRAPVPSIPAAESSAPVAAVIALRLLGVGASQEWLIQVGYLGMFLGMLIAMLYRRDHYTGKAHH